MKAFEIWGVDGDSIDEKRLAPIGLVCWGGSSNNKGMTYHVHNKDLSFDVELNQKDFDDVDKIYKKFLRKQKLNKINNL